jgi:16S rRNA (guanine966-N2)-methyltransferase
MRVISGQLGGRTFQSPNGHRTHPMSDKIRGALFNVLGNLDGLTVLDAYAGSGALAFEAISRGAASAVTLDSDRAAQQSIANNITALSLRSRVKLIKTTVAAWLNTSNDSFDVVIADPPYDGVNTSALQELAARTRAGGIYVVSLPPLQQLDLPPATYALLSTKAYGDAQLVFYRRIS